MVERNHLLLCFEGVDEAQDHAYPVEALATLFQAEGP
jgi:hypothetical protein